MPPLKNTGPARPKLHEQLSLNVEDTKVRAYVEAAIEYLERSIQGQDRALRNKIDAEVAKVRILQAENDALREALMAVSMKLDTILDPDGDDKYALTKAKLIKFMKSQGWA